MECNYKIKREKNQDGIPASLEEGIEALQLDARPNGALGESWERSAFLGKSYHWPGRPDWDPHSRIPSGAQEDLLLGMSVR